MPSGRHSATRTWAACAPEGGKQTLDAMDSEQLRAATSYDNSAMALRPYPANLVLLGQGVRFSISHWRSMASPKASPSTLAESSMF
eukprot:Skav201623  [mRNA]  locus=scaffold3582:8276:8533:- [translate_table: standard]